jgi:hypothetical protein
LLVLSLFLLILPLSTGSCLAVGTFEDEVTIGIYDYQLWEIDTDGDDVDYHVEVISGGEVDVYIVTDLVEYPWALMVDVLPGHSHEGVMKVEDTLKDRSRNSHLLVDNSDGMGIDPSGDVTVKVQWEPHDSLTFWLILLSIVLILVATFFILLLKAPSRRAKISAGSSTSSSIEGTGAVYAIEEPEPSMPSVPPPDPPPTICPTCGSMMRIDMGTGVTYCPRCD